MSTSPTRCPKCESTDVRFDPQHGEAFCTSCKHDWRVDSSSPKRKVNPVSETPLKVFLSYGHDEHAADAQRIKADLEERGHDVWFDEERLKVGRDWELYIEQGLKNCDKVVLLMTPHSVRRPNGYCLNEIAKALERNKLIIPVLLVELEDGPPTSICRIQYLDLRDAIPVREREERYRQRFDRLVRAIEQDALDFEGGQARLQRWLRPLDYQSLIAPHIARFTGRRWLLKELDDWLRQRPESRVFWILGGPGIGKSAVAAWLCHRRAEVVASHFCVSGHDDKSDPRRVVFSLAYQLAQHLPAYERHLQQVALEEEQAKNAQTLFDNLILGPLSKSEFEAPVDHQLVVIDAIDEATRDGRNEVADFIARNWSQTPPWLRLVITSRPEPEIVCRLQRSDLQPFVLDAQSPENRADLRDYLRTELQRLELPTDDRTLRSIIEKSEGMFLYIATVVEELIQGGLSTDRLDEFPHGMASYYRHYFDRRFPNSAEYRTSLRPVLNAIVAQREPLPVNLLAAATRLTDFELRECLQSLGSLFPVQWVRTEADVLETIVPFHNSVADWLTARDEVTGTFVAGPYAVDLKSGQDALTEACWHQYRSGVEPLSDYALRHLPEHLTETVRWDDLETLLTDLAFLERKVRFGKIFDLAGDFTRAVEALPVKRPTRRILKLLEEALRRDIHFIARHAEDYPQGLFQCLWNHGWWYDCPQAAKHYEGSPPDFTAEFAPPIFDTPAPPKLHELLERWREQKARRSPGFPWLRSLRPPPVHLGTAQQAVFRGHEKWVTSVAFSPDGTRIASGSRDNTVRVWDAASGAELACLNGHENFAISVAFSPDGQRIVSGSWDKTVRVWDAASGAELACLKGHDGWVNSAVLSQDGRRIVSGSRDKTVRVWDAGTGAVLACLKGHEEDVSSVAFPPEGRWIASGSYDQTVRLWDVENEVELACFEGHTSAVKSVVFSPDGRRIASGSWDNTVRVWDVESGAELTRLEGHERTVESMAFSPDGCWIATVSRDKSIRIWDAVTEVELACLKGHEGSVYDVSFSPGGRWIATGSADKTIRVWDTSCRAELACLSGHKNDIESVAFAPDGARVASGSLDTTVRLWDAKKGTELSCLKGHDRSVVSVVFSPDGRRIASGSEDATVRVWHADSGAEHICLKGHEDLVTTVFFSPDGQRIISVSLDNTARVWEAETGQCLEVIGRRAHAAGIEAGENVFTLRAMARGQETVIESIPAAPTSRAAAGPSRTDQPLTSFPQPLGHIATNASGRRWAGAVGSYLCLLQLEGEIAGMETPATKDNR